MTSYIPNHPFRRRGPCFGGSRVRFSAAAVKKFIFPLRHRVQAASMAQPPPSSADVKNAWNYTYTPLYAFMSVPKNVDVWFV
jgi:hypothetical protein